MHVLVDIPDDLASLIIPPGQDPSRAVLEDALLQAYREDRITSPQLMQALGIETRYELDGFFKDHQVDRNAYTAANLDQDIQTVDEIRKSLS